MTDLFKLAQTLVRELSKKNLTLAVAESVTGGLLSSTIVDVPGSSQVFWAGLVTYSNSSKVALLGVQESTLEKHGAVSKECVREMLHGMARLSGADFNVATTGIAGPSGGSAEKPVGLSYIAWMGPGFEHIEKCEFLGERNNNRRACVEQALKVLLQRVEGGSGNASS